MEKDNPYDPNYLGYLRWRNDWRPSLWDLACRQSGMELMTEQTPAIIDENPAGMAYNFAASRNAVKAMMSVMMARWSTKTVEVEAWFDSYVELLCGTQIQCWPILTPEEIKRVFNEVMLGWTGLTFPKPGHFKTAVDELVKAKHQAKNVNPNMGERVRQMNEAYAAGQMWRRWSYVYERYPEQESRWINAEHWRGLYEDALRQLSEDPEAQRTVEAWVAEVEPWDPPLEPVKQVRGFRTVGRALKARHVPGGPGEAAAATEGGAGDGDQISRQN